VDARPLRIAFAAYRGNMQCGGQGIYLWFLARELAALGHRVDVYCGPPYPDPMPFAEELQPLPNEQLWGKWFARDWPAFFPADAPFRVLSPLHFYELAASYLGFLPEPFAFSARAFRALTRRVRAGRRYDLVHDVQCLGWGMLGVRALGVPVVTTIHHPLTVDRRASFVRDRNVREAVGTMAFHPVGMQGFVARRIDRVLTSSETSAASIARDFRVPRARIRNVWNGLDTELFRPDPGVERSATELLCIGRATDPTKGVRILLEALARLPEHVRLTLVDDAGPANPARGWARKLGCAERVTWTGRIANEELVRLYNRAAVVVVPSRFEGFGLPAVEAMACGAPVVASAAGALREVVRAGGGGVLVPAAEPEALARTLDALLEAPEQRRALGARGRERVVKRFSWPRIARATVEAYCEVLDARGRPASSTTSAWRGNRRAHAPSA
jgi:glycosyltransferase involved in cell wall biosynthesis